MTGAIARRYHRFAAMEAKGHSPLHEILAMVLHRIPVSWFSSPVCRYQDSNPICCLPRPASCAARQPTGVSVPALAAEAPPDATLVVFHTAVLAYIADLDARAEFARAMRTLNAVWIGNEAPHVFPDIAAKLTASGPKDAFLLAVNGEPIAWTDPHGAWIDWIRE